MDHIIRIGMDTSKHIFQLHGVNAAEEPVLRRKLRRKDMVNFFAGMAPVTIAIEACWTCPGKVESFPDVKGELDDEATTVYAGV